MSGLEGQRKGIHESYVSHMEKEGQFFAASRFPEHNEGEGEGFLNLHSFQEHKAWVKFNMVKHTSVDLLPCVKPWAAVVKTWPSCIGLTFLGGRWAKPKPRMEKSIRDYARSSKNKNRVVSANRNHPSFIKVKG